METRSTVRAGLVALAAVLGGAACSGGDGPPGSVADREDGVSGGAAEAEAGDAGGAGAGSGTATGDIDLCSLLVPAEIEAQFGERGAVREGRGGQTCQWDVGDPMLVGEEGGPGIVQVTNGVIEGAGSAELQYGSMEGALPDATPVEGVGDEAVYTGDGLLATLWFRSGDAFLGVGASFSPTLDGTQEKLATLAQHIIDRL